MNQPSARAGLRSLAVALALCTAALVGAACAPTAAPAPAVQATVAAPVAQPPQAPQSAAATQDQGSQEPGASAEKNPAAADTRHFKGDPNAAIVVIEASDFQ